MAIQGTNELRLEVEVPTAGLPNLVQNHSGHKGAWGWLTPITDTNMRSNGTELWFRPDVSKAAHFTTEFLPVAAGKHVGARIDLTGITVNHNIKARYEFYDANKVLLSSGTQTGALSAVQTHYVASAQAPTNTAHVKLRVDFYKGTANPDANATAFFNKAMVTWADTAEGLGSTRTNLIPNPSFETDTSGWVASRGGMTISRTTSQFVVGVASLQMTNTAAGTYTTMSSQTTWGTGGIAVTGGSYYSVQAQFRSPNSRTAQVGITWWKSDGSGITTNYVSTTLTANTWKLHSGTFTAPSNAAYASAYVAIYHPPGTLAANEPAYIDAVMLEKSSTVGTYIEGSVASGNYAFSEPNDWRNILGPTSYINTNRKALDVGTLSATILDALLDPAVSSTIRPGKKVRLRALVDGLWQSVYEGALVNANTTYDKDKVVNGVVETRIDITAADNVAHLGNQGESRGVANISDLPFLLEGKGAPWNINGSGNQISTATIVFYNENASILDQAAITRDSKLGYAWVDRTNVFNVWDSGSLSNTPVVTFSDAVSQDPLWLSYRDIDVNFNTDSCINNVLVQWLRYDVVTGATEEIAYGPYKDALSINTWGAHTAEFTIGGATESASSIQAYANSILTANATPQIRCNSLTMPVRNNKERKYATTLDLYSSVAVKYDTKVDKTLRITGIEQNIAPDLWTTTYSFDVQGSVASPTWTPSPPFTGVAGVPYVVRYKSTNEGMANNVWTKVQYGAIEDNIGVTYSAGVFTVERAGRYFIRARVGWANNITGRRHLGIWVNDTTIIDKDHRNASAGSTVDLTNQCSIAVRLAVGDTITVKAWQNSGASLDVIGTRDVSNVSMTWLGE